MRLFTVLLALGLCVATTPARAQDQPGEKPGGEAAPKAPQAPSPTMHFSREVVFTMALGNDPATNAKIAVALAARLHANGLAGKGPVRTKWIVPQGSWSLADYYRQCAKDPKTVGAFIVLPTATANSAENYIVLLRNKTEVVLSMVVAICSHPEKPPEPGENTSVAWASFTEKGLTGRSQIEFFPLAILTSVYLAFAPQRTTTTTTTTVYPVTTPIPAAGERSNVQTTQSNVLNAQGTATLQQGVVTSFAGGFGSTIGSPVSPEHQTLHAADDALGHVVVDQFDKWCNDKDASYDAYVCSW